MQEHLRIKLIVSSKFGKSLLVTTDSLVNATLKYYIYI